MTFDADFDSDCGSALGARVLGSSLSMEWYLRPLSGHVEFGIFPSSFVNREDHEREWGCCDRTSSELNGIVGKFSSIAVVIAPFIVPGKLLG